MKKLLRTFAAFITLALVVEVAILITTKAVGWDSAAQGRPWIVSAHVHILVLGAFLTLVLMILEKLFGLCAVKGFGVFYTLYLVGFSLVLTFILYKGFTQLAGAAPVRGLLEGGAAIAHTTMFVALFWFCAVLARAVRGIPVSGTNADETEAR